MKKEYIKPVVSLIKVECLPFLSGSGENVGGSGKNGFNGVESVESGGRQDGTTPAKGHFNAWDTWDDYGWEE